jgi:hypothetical protein
LTIAIRLFALILPFVLSVTLGAAIAEGFISFGSGEKDLFLVVPFLLWSTLYALGFVVLWWRGAMLKRTIGGSAFAATVLLAIAWAGLAVYVSMRVS